ncbi:MAG: caspase family protein [Bacteroidia bacterium]|nr:caspase family protein [Bacteroidia bacterium]
MKKVIAVLIFVLVEQSLFGQELRTRTNEVHVASIGPASRTTVPTIVWISPMLEYTNSLSTQVEIEADVQSDVPLKSILVILGDNLQGYSRGQKKMELIQDSAAKHFVQKLILQDGSNYIEIVAENIYGVKVSSIRNVLVGKEAVTDAVSVDRKDYALFFATDTYDYWKNLVNPIYDANTIAAELKSKYGFEVEVVENANQSDILVKIKDYSKRNFKPQDQLFVFFAGHGQFDEAFGSGYIVAKNSLEVDVAKTTYISHANLRDYIDNISCKHILLAMDVCFGGTLDPAIAHDRSGGGRDELTDSEFLARKLSKKTRRYISSGGKEYVSDGVLGKHSPFAARFLESLKSRGGEDQILTINEILPYLERIKDHEPRSGEFGDNEKGSDFVFVAKRN